MLAFLQVQDLVLLRFDVPSRRVEQPQARMFNAGLTFLGRSAFPVPPNGCSAAASTCSTTHMQQWVTVHKYNETR